MHSDCNDRFSDKNISDDKLVSGINGAQKLVTDLAGFACKYLIILLLWEAWFPFVRNFNKKKTKQVRCVTFSRGWRRSIPTANQTSFFQKGREFESRYVNHHYTEEEKEKLATFESVDYLPPHSTVYKVSEQLWKK